MESATGRGKYERPARCSFRAPLGVRRKMITSGQALWIINNLPQNPPSSSIMPSVWQNSRRQVMEALQKVVDAQPSAQSDGAKVCPECGSELLDSGYCPMGHWVGTPTGKA